jgi:hypothetical protein
MVALGLHTDVSEGNVNLETATAAVAFGTKVTVAANAAAGVAAAGVAAAPAPTLTPAAAPTRGGRDQERTLKPEPETLHF